MNNHQLTQEENPVELNEDKLNEAYRLNNKRRLILLIQVVGTLTFLFAQILIVVNFSLDIMICYPLLILVWNIIFLVIGVKIGDKIRKLYD